MPRDAEKQKTDDQTPPLEERNSQQVDYDLDDDEVGILAPDLSRDEPPPKREKQRDEHARDEQDKPETGVISPT